jgi:hypothetical protein
MDPGESNNAFSADRKQLPVLSKNKLVFAASIFLVSVPVFIQAPLVRLLPWLSLALTLALVGLGWQLLHRAKTQIVADLLLGFTWTWFCGSIYWGWFRWEPFWHLPIEAIGLPFAVWGIACNRGKVGNFFYLGSLLGTAVTDLYFYLVDLMPYWRRLMQVDESAVRPIFQSAIAQIQSSWGMGCAITLAAILVIASFFPLHSQKLHWWSFSGAVLSTILVDSLFWLAASIA